MFNIENIHQYYGGSHTLRGVSLRVRRGEVACLLGRNGVGKSTLLKCLMGLLPIREGAVLLEGEDISRLSPDRRAALGLAYVPQGREIFPRLTVEENLAMGLANGPASRGIPDLAFELFPILKTMLKRRGGDLSGGQQQQLAIARALVTHPKVLMLDEPTEGIQPSIIKDIERAIRRLAEAGEMAILLVEQYYDFAESLADAYAVMARGEIVMSGRGETMRADNARALVSI
ncbi:MAG: urea ABC transporter ATP-binding subunit UrtE [Azoarcus sp.]|jgi:urea transport system ATP-binding protein|nr:urea ABC transporter ATP-binding subunit UrtE [Azoarcus sp.]